MQISVKNISEWFRQIEKQKHFYLLNFFSEYYHFV